MKINNIFSKVFLLLILIVGWSGNVWAERFQPNFETNLNTNSTNWYYIQFFNKGASGYFYSQDENAHFKHGNNSVQNPAYFWQLIGDKDAGFKLVSMAGEYAYWNNDFLTGTTDQAQAATFKLINGTDGDSWAIQKVNPSNGKPCLNPQGSNEIKSWDNDNGCRIRFYIAEAANLEAAKETAFPSLGTLGDVNLVFQDNLGRTLVDQVVIYTPTSGPIVNLTPSLTRYDFGNVECLKTQFTLPENYKTLNINYDDGTETLTFTVTTDPNSIQYSSEPSATNWAPGTKWFTIRNNRSGQANQPTRPYLSTSEAFVDNNYQLINSSTPTTIDDRGGVWCFVGDMNSFKIQNAAYGPDYVLGYVNSRFKMVHKNNLGEAQVVFSTTNSANTQWFDGASHGYVFRIGTSGSDQLHSNNTGFISWNGGGSLRYDDGGSVFKVAAVDDDLLESYTAYDVYNVSVEGSPSNDITITYSNPTKFFGRRNSITDGSIVIMEQGCALELSEFNITGVPGYNIKSVTIDNVDGHSCKNMTFDIADALATVDWTFHVNDNYTTTYKGKQILDGKHFYLRPNATPKAIEFTINAPADKFVWGPVIDTKAKTVTYEVRERATEFTTGWYQLQLAMAQSEINSIANKIKEDEGNINTSANTLYLAPATMEPGDNRHFKITGVPTDAKEASTYVYILKNGENNYTFTNPTTGAQYTGDFTFNGGRLEKNSGWSMEDPVHPLEGPFIKPTGNSAFAFNVAAVDISQYKIYQIITNDATVQLSVNNSDVQGNKVVKNGGYVFLPKDANAPVRSQFSVINGNATVTQFVIGEEADGVTTITITLDTRKTYWRAIITGDAKTDADRVIYNGINYVNEALIPLPYGSKPSAVDFKTNITDRFVWGPTFNENLQTVTFEVREPAADLEAGAWYQLQLSPTAEGRYFVPNETGNLVEGVLKMNPRNAGSQIYMIGANKTSGSWTVELIGKPANEAETYLYINYRNGNTTQMMMQNGYYITDQSQYSSSASNTQFQYNSATHEFHWRNPVYPWGNLNGMNAAVGKSASADGSIKVIAHKVPVKAYKVVLTNGSGTLVYNGDAEIIGSRRAANGYFFFAKEDQMLEGEGTTIDISKFDLRGVDGSINSITSNTNNGITTLTVNVEAPTYNHEIIHKQNRFYDYLETDAIKPNDGFIQYGEGWKVRTGKNSETIREQNTSLFEIPVYLMQGGSIDSYLPTNQLASYQRWYDWDTDGQVDRTVLTNALPGYTQYNNGFVIFRGAQNGNNVATKPTLTLPSTMTEYNVGLDISRWTDYVQNPVGADGSAIEPTLGMRIVYQVRDAKKIAKAIKDSTELANTFFEKHDIALPNVQYGSRAKRLEDRTLSTTLPMDMDLNNYWGFNSGGTGNENLVQLTEDNQLRVEVTGNAPIQNVMMIPGSSSNASGNISRSTDVHPFNQGHFVLFQYPDNGYIDPNATATINVYMTSGDVEYKLVQFNLTFISNANPVVVTELKNSYRHPDALAEEFGSPVTELTFDQTPNYEFGITEDGVFYPDYRYPLDYKGASYAFGARNTNRNWAASRGEYALTSFNASSAQTGTPRIAYYPVTNYLSSMADASAALAPKKEGAYQLYIDAADQPGKIASIALDDALCAGSRLYCYGYIGCTSGGTGQHPTSVLINVMGINKNTDEEELIYSYCPGIITLRGYAEDGRTIYSTALGNSSSYSTRDGAEDRNYWAPWQQIGFSFAIDATTAAKMKGYSIQIMNNAYNSNGGDTMLDDFQIYVKKPGAEVANTTPLCSDQIRHIKVITEYETLLEATGEDSNHDGLMNVGFCFLDKAVYDRVLAENADKDAEHGYPRNDPENKFNKAFGEALMGNRTIDRTNKDHAFHNFNIIRDGLVSNIYGETKKHYYTDIPQYSFKESSDDVVYRDSIRGERYIVFKESVAHGEPSSISNHKWTAGKQYYLLFSTATITDAHVNNHDLGCTVFNLDDNKCSVLYEFTVAPPVSIKGDVEEITSGDEVQACFGQTATLSVNLNGRTDTKDVIIKNLNYDWWMSAPTHEVYKMEYGVPVRDANGYRIALDSEDNEIANDAEGNPTEPGKVQVKEYNTVPATLQNYMNVWYGTYQQDNAHLGKVAGEKIYLSDAMLEFRRAYPNAIDLNGVVPIHKTGDTVEYELTQDMIDCIAHFLEPDENGYPPLLLYKKEKNLTLGKDYADAEGVVHFTVIPIAPSIYSPDEDAIYCPDPQELKIRLMDEGPSLANGFNNMLYPETMENVPMRVGMQQINNVRHRSNPSMQRTLTVPLRKARFAYPEVAQRFIKTIEPDVLLVGTDDPAYKATNSITQDTRPGSFTPGADDMEDMFIQVGTVVDMQVEKNADNPTMQIIFDGNTVFREGYTYTLKVKYYEVKSDNSRDLACEGSFVFDMKVVPEYQVWTAGAGNSDWTNDKNWARADRSDLKAGAAATGNKMAGATALDDATSYESNEQNTTSSSFVPMYFTNVLLNNPKTKAPELYKSNEFMRPLSGTRFLEGLDNNTSTPFITYDMEVTPVNAADRTSFNYDCNYKCELFDTYIANGVTFEPATQMGNAHYLTYNKVWVEYELEANRWYTLASPLKKSVAGDWYSPTAGGKQLTPHFYDINYSESLNDRYRPAYYQRSWDRAGNNIVYEKSGNQYDAYVKADWSNVYNDATVNYSSGGFSVKPELDYTDPSDWPADGKVLVRLPKADVSYTYYGVDGSTGSAADAQIGSRADSYRLLSDDLGADGSGTITLDVSNATADNNFLLLSNPFMAAMDMDAFFQANDDLEQMYWIADGNRQVVSMKTASDGEWITTDGSGKYVAPLQGFFVKKKATALSQNTISGTFNKNMQVVVNQVPGNNENNEELITRAAAQQDKLVRLTAERNGMSSSAVIMLSENAHDSYTAGEDCEAFIDGNLYDIPTIYTSSNAIAQTINVRKTINMVPVGIVSSDDSEATLRISISENFCDRLYLYDSTTDDYTEIDNGSELTLSGNTAGRYYITTSIGNELHNDASLDNVRPGVWNTAGQYFGKTVEGLRPGLYIVDGVKMILK